MFEMLGFDILVSSGILGLILYFFLFCGDLLDERFGDSCVLKGI